MLKTYKPYPNHKIFGVQILLKCLVLDVWCKADSNNYENKLNDELKRIAKASKWFRTGIEDIYKVCQNLDADKKLALKKIFTENNKIQELCENPSKRIFEGTLDDDLLVVLKPFLKSFYSQLMELLDVKKTYGSKKEYYNDLVKYNKKEINRSQYPFYCPCCGFGNLKSTRDKGYSPFDHYLPKKHYVFSVVNFENLVPLCHDCNSSYKGEKDILKSIKKVFFPFNTNHPNIEISTTTKATIFPLIIPNDDDDDLDEINEAHIEIRFNINSEEISSWNEIFGIKTRYLDQIVDNASGWLKKVKKCYKQNSTFQYVDDAFNSIVDLDVDESLWFLEKAFLTSIKSHESLVDAYFEVEGNHRISA